VGACRPTSTVPVTRQVRRVVAPPTIRPLRGYVYRLVPVRFTATAWLSWLRWSLFQFERKLIRRPCRTLIRQCWAS